jgi:branched-chain amino acid transport system substrate-binding protein
VSGLSRSKIGRMATPKRATIGALIVATALITSLGLVGTTYAGGGPGGHRLTFGVALSLTGSTAVEGRLILNGYRLWARTVDSRGGIVVRGVPYQIAIRNYDDQSNPSLSARLTQRLVSVDRVNFLLGPYGSAATLADEVVAQRNHVPMVEGGGASTAIFSSHNPYIFGVISPAPRYGDIMLRAATAVSHPPRTLAIIYASDPFSTEVAATSRAFALAHGVKVVAYKHYPTGDTNLTGVVSSLKSAKPDMLLGSGHASESIAVMEEARQLGFNPKLFAFTVGPATPSFTAALGAAANDVITSVQWTPAQRLQGIDAFGTPANYARIYASTYGQQPAYQAAAATAAGLAYQYAIQRAGSLDRQRVRNALAQLRVQTFFGTIRFDARGANVYKSMAVMQIQRGRPLTVYPRAIATARLVYPTPPFRSR